MILWLNGPFGVGKATVTARLCQRVPGAQVFDPEHVGWVIRRTVGVVRHADYQDQPLWRRMTVELAGRRAARTPLLVVPMTVLRPAVLAELLDGLRGRGHEVRHVLLDVSPDVLIDRVERDEFADPRAWRMENLQEYLTARPVLRCHGDVLDTDELDAAGVVDAVLATLARTAS